jgi:hypothetical protein
MDASKLTQMRQEAAIQYKSNWQPRDASEVTLRDQSKAVKANPEKKWSPVVVSCSNNCSYEGSPAGNYGPYAPTSGYSPTYDADTISLKNAGKTACCDENFGAPFGITLKTCQEISTILYEAPNPVLGVPPCCKSSEQIRRAIYSACNITPAYTGIYNQVPTNNAYGFQPVFPPNPSH